MNPISVLLVSNESTSFAALVDEFLIDGRISISRVDSCRGALDKVKEGGIDVVIVDEELPDGSGLAFIQKVVSADPIINCALVSPLYPQEFHQETEGLGVLAQLPRNPGSSETKQLLEQLEIIYGRSNRKGGSNNQH